MKPLFAALALLGLAACNTTTQSDSAAFQSAPSPVTYGQSYHQPAASQTSHAPSVETIAYAETRAPGWYKLPNGLPLAVVQSNSLRTTGRPATDYEALNTAFRSENRKYSTRLDTAHGTAEARLVSVDGMTFLVMTRLRVKEVLKVLFYTREPYEKLMEASIHQSGCTRAGKTIVRANNQQVVSALSARVSC